MPDDKTARSLARAQMQLKRAEERVRREKKKLRDAERKADTRRKIILGSWLLSRAAEHEATSRTLATIVNKLERPADRAAFDGFRIPHPDDKRD